MQKVYKCLATLAAIFAIAVQGKAQIKQYKDCNSYKKPLILRAGDTVVNFCDSALLINTTRYNLYEEARQTIITNRYGKLQQSLDDSLQLQIAIYQRWNDSLQLKYETVSKMFQSSLDSTRSHLKIINNNIDNSKSSLEKANKSLDNAIKHINNAVWEKWLWGGTGLVIGAILVKVIL